MIRKLIRFGALAGAVTVLAACDDDSLKVVNPNQPETERVFASAKDMESLLGSYYRRWHIGVYGNSISNVQGMMSVMSFENYSSLANNGMNARAGIPRPGNDNNIGNVVAAEQRRIYDIMAEVNRVSSNILTTMADPGFGSMGTTSQDIRARAFAEFLRGLSLGYLALIYDSAAVIAQGMSTQDRGELRGYREVMDSANAALSRAIAHANHADAGGTGGFPIPGEWLPTSTIMTPAEFVRLARSYRARFEATVARTPTERANAPWAAIVADAQNGITATHDNITSTTTGPYNAWVQQWQGFSTWHQMTPFIMGMADVSDNYQAWIGKPLGDRDGFTMVTPDLRFPQGATRALQQADFTVTGCSSSATPCKRYFRNRPAGEDLTNGLGWGWSEYDFARWRGWAYYGDNGQARNGRFPFFTKAELDMLQAEGLIRLGGAANLAAAANLINITRTGGMVGGVATGGGLTPVTAAGIPNEPGGACVPRRVTNASHAGGDTVGCWVGSGVSAEAQLMEAMKWEKRIEMMQTAFGAWFMEGRGWGDLTAGTPFHWAAPFQDLQARQRPIYSADASTNAVAATSVYGW